MMGRDSFFCEVIMSENILLIFELIGTLAFAVSGAMVGLKKEMDIFGIVILGLCTAVGGGFIRDLVLGITPPVMFQKPVYAAVAVLTSLFVFLPPIRRYLSQSHRIFDAIMLLMDSIGLGVFTVVGVQAAFRLSGDSGLFLLCFVGVITGVGGGIIRDVLAGNTPHVFVKHFYACASLLGALACALLWRWLGNTVAILGGAALVVVLRLCAARFRWSLPKAKWDGGAGN